MVKVDAVKHRKKNRCACSDQDDIERRQRSGFVRNWVRVQGFINKLNLHFIYSSQEGFLGNSKLCNETRLGRRLRERSGDEAVQGKLRRWRFFEVVLEKVGVHFKPKQGGLVVSFPFYLLKYDINVEN